MGKMRGRRIGKKTKRGENAARRKTEETEAMWKANAEIQKSTQFGEK